MPTYDVTVPVDLVRNYVAPSYAGPGFNGTAEIVAFATNLSAAYPAPALTVRVSISGQATTNKASLSTPNTGEAFATVALSGLTGDLATYFGSATIPAKIQVVDFWQQTNNTTGSASFILTFDDILLASTTLYLSAYGTNFGLVNNGASRLDNLDSIITDGSAPALARIRSVGGRARLVQHLG